jgi:hypothetical protein
MALLRGPEYWVWPDDMLTTTTTEEDAEAAADAADRGGRSDFFGGGGGDGYDDDDQDEAALQQPKFLKFAKCRGGAGGPRPLTLECSQYVDAHTLPAWWLVPAIAALSIGVACLLERHFESPVRRWLRGGRDASTSTLTSKKAPTEQQQQQQQQQQLEETGKTA